VPCPQNISLLIYSPQNLPAGWDETFPERWVPTLGLVFTPHVFVIQHKQFQTYTPGQREVSEVLVNPFLPRISVGMEEGWKEPCGMDCPGLVSAFLALMKQKKSNPVLHQLRSALSGLLRGPVLETLVFF